MVRPLVIAIVAALVLASHPFRAAAQSTVWNTPSTDVVAAGALYLEADAYGHVREFESAGYFQYGTRVVVGLPKDTEVGVSAYGTADAASHRAELQANVKHRFLLDEHHDIAVAIGGIGYVPTGPDEARVSAALYAVSSARIAGPRSPRFSCGVLGIVGAGGGSRLGATVGVDQAIGRRVVLYADWCGSASRFGYSGAGLGFALSRSGMLFAGYNVGNEGRANNSFTLCYGYTF
jgi:hypothetical protein